MTKSKQVKVLMGPVKSTILPGSYPISKVLDICTYKPSWAVFSPKVQMGLWDGKIRLASMKREGGIVFPTGLMDRIAEFLIKEGYEVVYKTSFPERRFLNRERTIQPLKGVEPRHYQIAATEACLEFRRGVLKMPTGSGKTIVAAMLTKAVKGHTIFLTHKKDILHQTFNSFQKMIGAQYVGMVGDGRKDWNYITCCMVQTLHRCAKAEAEKLNKVGLLIVDEVHLATSPSWYNLTMKIPAEFRIGLTATPLQDARSTLLEAATGPIIYEAKSQQLIKEGYLSKPTIFMVRIKKPVLNQRYDYQDAYQHGIVENDLRNTKIVALIKTIKKERRLTPIVVLTKKIEHLKRLEELLSKTNLSYRILYGKDSASERQDVIKLLEARKLDVLVVSTIFDEGVDVRNIRTLIIASGGRSNEKTLQRLGRGMRTADGKSSVILIDFYDQTHEYLERHSKKRITSYKKEGYEINLLVYKNFKEQLNQL
jgi:superfamily II DNA or RNA helicase